METPARSWHHDRVAETPTIDAALDAFLADQRRRLSERTMRNYEYVVELLRDSLNGYGPNGLEKTELRRWQKAYDQGDEEAFCHLFGPERIVEHFGEFLGYFMVRKVWASQELLRSAGTVTKKLAGWLFEHGYVSSDEREDAIEQGAARPGTFLAPSAWPTCSTSRAAPRRPSTPTRSDARISSRTTSSSSASSLGRCSSAGGSARSRSPRGLPSSLRPDGG